MRAAKLLARGGLAVGLTLLVGLAVQSAAVSEAADGRSTMLNLKMRTEIQPFKGSPEWVPVTLEQRFPASETALLICDMWDNHWCASAARRCGEIAKRMNPVVESARRKGVTIIHAPSDTMAFYQDAPQRKRMIGLPKVDVPVTTLPDPPLPIDDSDGGCDDEPQCRNHRAWTRQHPALRVADEDFISDKGPEVYSLLKQRGIRNLLVMGVHTNFCVLHRTFAIKQMTRAGIRCVLVRDLTDTMYNPRMRPQVSHDRGTELVVQHIERHWCPTVTSDQLTR